MADATAKPRLVRIAELLERYKVEFMVLGGEAAVLHGSPLPTFDTDLCYRRTPENLKRLAEVLREIHPTLRGAPADLPFRLDAESLALGANFTFETDFGPLDLLGWVEPLGSYEQLLRHAESIAVGDLKPASSVWTTSSRSNDTYTARRTRRRFSNSRRSSSCANGQKAKRRQH